MAKKPSLDDVWGMGNEPASRPAPARQRPAAQAPKTAQPTAVPAQSPPKTTRRKRSPSRQTEKAPVEVKPIRLTLYLDPSVVDLIDRSQLALKKQTGIRGHSISNSAVVEECVKLVLEQYLKRAATSELPGLITQREAERAKKKAAAKKS